MKSEIVHVSMPAELKKQAKTLADEHNYGSISRLVQHLLHREVEKKHGLARLEALLEEGYNSPNVDDSQAIFDAGKARIQAKIE